EQRMNTDDVMNDGTESASVKAAKVEAVKAKARPRCRIPTASAGRSKAASHATPPTVRTLSSAALAVASGSSALGRTWFSTTGAVSATRSTIIAAAAISLIPLQSEYA